MAAEGGIRAGVLRLYPALSLLETYDSNIFLTAGDEKDDFITDIRPTLKIVLPLRNFYLQAEGSADFIDYLNNDSEDNKVFKAAATAGANFPGGLGLVIADTFNRGYINKQEDFSVAEYYDIKQMYVNLSYAIRGDFKVELEYFNYLFTYAETDDLDRGENTFAGTLFVKFLPKTSALLEIGYSDIAYSADSFTYKDNIAFQVRGGLMWTMTGKTTGELRIGYQRKSYNSESLGDGNNVVAAWKISTEFSKYTFLDSQLTRGTYESDYPNNPYFLSTRLNVDLSHKFTYKISGLVGLRWRQDAYPNETTENDETGKRTDNIIGADIGVKFQMLRWLSLKVEYNISHRTSEFGRFDYNDSRLTLGVNAAF